MPSKTPYFVLMGLFITGVLMITANIWFDHNFSLSLTLNSTPAINPTPLAETTPLVNIIPYNSPTIKPLNNPTDSPQGPSPTPTPPTSTPLPTNTPIPQNVQITTTLTTQTFVCPQSYSATARSILNQAETNVAPIDTTYHACANTADVAGQTCIDSCNQSLGCMQNCGNEIESAYQICTTNRDVLKNPIVDAAVSQISSQCFVVE